MSANRLAGIKNNRILEKHRDVKEYSRHARPYALALRAITGCIGWRGSGNRPAGYDRDGSMR
jgi:hypothetical protein